MRQNQNCCIQMLIIAVAGGIVYKHKEYLFVAKLPPESLKQWYKPVNKRQVWLHNMFKLRRELQAISLYSQANNLKLMDKWMQRFNEHYLEIAKMVPEWNQETDIKALSNLQFAVNNNGDVQNAVAQISENCKQCHDKYRAVTTLLYRSADFSKVEGLAPSVSLKTHMLGLTKSINYIKISAEDGDKKLALSSLLKLEEGIQQLGETCSECHDKEPEPYPDDEIVSSLLTLKNDLQHGTYKQQSRTLGTIAVIACSRCHGTHRVVYDIKNRFIEHNGFDLLFHIR